MMRVSEFLRLVDCYEARTGVTDKTFSSRMFGEPTRLSALRGGADMGTKRLEHGVQHLADHWPSTLVWPSDLPRPAPSILVEMHGAPSGDPIVATVNAGVDRRVALLLSGRTIPEWIDGPKVFADVGIDLAALRARICA